VSAPIFFDFFLLGLPQALSTPLSPVPNPSTCPFVPGARKPVSVVILIDACMKKDIMMQPANVSHGKTKMVKMVRRRELPCVRRSLSLYRG
jgi:hypothetical protein